MTTKYAILLCGLFLAEDNQGATDSGRAVYLPLKFPKELGSLYQENANTKGNVLSKDNLHSMANICSPNICSYLSVNCLSPFGEAADLFLFSQAQDGI